MSTTEKKYELKQGNFTLHKQSEDAKAENPSRPDMWGKMCVPKDCKAGDEIKLSAWAETSQACKKYLSGKCEVVEKPSSNEKSDSEISDDDLPF